LLHGLLAQPEKNQRKTRWKGKEAKGSHDGGANQVHPPLRLRLKSEKPKKKSQGNWLKRKTHPGAREIIKGERICKQRRQKEPGGKAPRRKLKLPSLWMGDKYLMLITGGGVNKILLEGGGERVT